IFSRDWSSDVCSSDLELERALIAIGEVIDGDDMDELVARDTHFHELIYRASRNSRLAQMTSLLSEQIQRFRARTLAHPKRRRIRSEERRVGKEWGVLR